MLDKPVLFDLLRKSKLMGPTLDTREVQGVDAILDAAECHNLGAARIAYMIATAYHETAGTMAPIREYGSLAYLTRSYDIRGINPARARKWGNLNPGDGVKYCGRGLVQLTWHDNYKRAGEHLKIDLVGQPDLAMQLGIAAQIMVEGMIEGWFTGRTVMSLPAVGAASREQFQKARNIINGTDRADLIAGYALEFQAYLMKAGLK